MSTPPDGCANVKPVSIAALRHLNPSVFKANSSPTFRFLSLVIFLFYHPLKLNSDAHIVSLQDP